MEKLKVLEKVREGKGQGEGRVDGWHLYKHNLDKGTYKEWADLGIDLHEAKRVPIGASLVNSFPKLLSILEREGYAIVLDLDKLEVRATKAKPAKAKVKTEVKTQVDSGVEAEVKA